MFDKPKAIHTLGLEKSSSSIKCAILTYRRKKPSLDKAFELELDPAETDNVNQLYISEKGKELKASLEKNLVVTGINANETLVRPLDVKLKKEKDIDAVLGFQIEPLLPYPVENAQADKIILSKDAEGSHLTVIAIRKDHFAQHLEQWHAFNVEPEVISCVPDALANFAKIFAKSETPLFVIHLGTSHTVCVLVNEGKLIATQAIAFGLDQLAEAIGKDKQLELTSAKAYMLKMNISLPLEEPLPAFSQTLDTLRLEITRTLYALAKQIKGKEVPDILLTGEGASIGNLAATLCQNLNKNLLTPQENPNFPLTTSGLQSFAIPIGLALSVLPNATDQINFRQNEFAYPNPWKRLKGPLAIYFGLTLFVALALYLFGSAYQTYQENKLKIQYLELLRVMNKPFSEFEKELSGTKSTNKVPLKVKQLTQDDLKARLAVLQKEIQATPQVYPLLPNVPLVSDVLAWLSTHPSIVGKQQPGENAPEAIQIDSFSYTLVKRPELTKKQEKYQVKVEIEFSSPTPKMAREFHDALIAPNEFVDPKAEIKWNSNRDSYRASFFLKDKTVYPSP